jgi:hypothetical protein
LFQKILPPALKQMRSTPDNIEDYKQEYGYLGAALHAAVVKARQAVTVTTAAPASNTFRSITIGAQVREMDIVFDSCQWPKLFCFLQFYCFD